LLKTEIIPIRYGLVRAGGSSLSAADGNQPGGNQPAARSQTEGSQAGVEESDIEALLSWMEANWPGWPPQTKWRLDKKFNRLIICSTPDIIDEVKKMVAMLDVPPIQILISTRFVMVRENALDKLGFNWTLTPNPAMMPSKTRPGDQRKDWRDEKTRITTMQSNTGVAADAFAAGAVGVLNNHQLDFAMQALKSATGSKTLTAPRVVALNNKIAEIHLFDAYPYIETYQQQVSTITTDQTVQQAVTLIPQWQTKQLGHHLTVLPSVGADMKTISLRVTPRIDKVTGEVPRYIVVSNPDGTQRTVEWSYPIFTTDTLTAEAVLEDNQTLVIGGLFLDNESNTSKKNPIFSEIPLVGNLFKSKDKSRDRTCLLIFVTANILTPQNRHYTDDREPAARDLAAEEALRGRRISTDILNEWMGDPRR